MTYSDTQPRGTLRYRLLSASLRPADSPLADPGTWGHEYVRHLAAELGEEYTLREQGDVKPAPSATESVGEQVEAVLPGTIEDLHSLARQCAVFLLGHNAEPDAVDLLEELEIVDQITELVDENTFNRVCQYMIRYVLGSTTYLQESPELSLDVSASCPLRTIFPSCGQRTRYTFSITNSQMPSH